MCEEYLSESKLPDIWQRPAGNRQTEHKNPIGGFCVFNLNPQTAPLNTHLRRESTHLMRPN